MKIDEVRSGPQRSTRIDAGAGSEMQSIGIELPFGYQNSSAQQDIRELWPDCLAEVEHLVQFLNDHHGAVYILNGTANNGDFILSTPRLRVQCRIDRFGQHLVALHIKSADPGRFLAEKRKGVQCENEWCVATGTVSPGLTPLLERLRDKHSSQAEEGTFWEFWNDFLEIERVQIQKAKGDPGWSYVSRRWGLAGAIDFEVGTAAGEIQQLRSRLLIELNGDAEEDLSGRKTIIRFELMDTPTKGWISAIPLGAKRGLDEIPPHGQLTIDWVGLQSEFNRRHSALQKLRNGQTAMPQLNAILPYGPTTAASGTSFFPILRDVEYDPGQRRSIESALAPNTIALIMGPPGTGKTSVIAEIAAQIVAQGGRVLIASQSNLAVDNALEKILPAKNIFAVRIGNVESVKLNKDLHWDNAAERYRRILLERSKAALASERDSILNQKCDYSADQISAAIEGTAETVKAFLQFQTAKSAQELAAAEHVAANQRLLLAHSSYSTLIAKLGLSEPELATVLSVVPLVEGKGWRAVDLWRNAEELRRVWRVKEAVSEANKTLEDYRKNFRTMLTLLQKRRRLEGRIQQSTLKEQRLADIIYENKKIESRRRSAVGWWDTLRSHVFEWKTDLSSLEQELQVLDRHGAEIDLGGTKNTLSSVHEHLKGIFEQCLGSAAKIGGIQILSSRYDHAIVEEADKMHEGLLVSYAHWVKDRETADSISERMALSALSDLWPHSLV